MSYDVLLIGRPVCDLVFTGLPRWPALGREVFADALTLTAGGAFNTVVALTRLGYRVGLIGVAGNDMWSRLCLSLIEEEGVSTELMCRVDRPMPSVSVCMNYQQDRGFLSYEATDDELTRVFADHAVSVLRRQDARYLQTYLSPGVDAYAAVARERGMQVFMDCAWDESWLSSAQIRDILPVPDIVMVSEAEAKAIAGVEQLEPALDLLEQLHPFLVIKQGSRGATAARHGSRLHVNTRPVDVVDATGAGDCFNAGFLYGWDRGLPVETCMRLGNLCGGRSVQVPGGYAGAPTEQDLRTDAAALGIQIPT